MEQLYNDIYRVGTLFQENKYQKIFMGDSVQDPELVVVINELAKSELIDSTFVHTLKDSLSHLLHFEEDEEKAVFVTAYGEGMSIFQVIDNYPNTTRFRMNLLHDYLNTLRAFDALLPVFQYILAGDSQFYLKSSDLVHSELMIIDEDQFDPALSFDQVKNRIAAFSQKVLDFEPAPQDETIVATLRGFFDDLESDLSLNTLDKIYRAYRKVYIYDLYLDKDESDTVVVAPIITATDAPEPPEPKAKTLGSAGALAIPYKDNKILLFNKEKYAINPLLIALIILAVGIALFAIFTPMINRISETEIPVASFEKEKVDDHWKFLNLSKTFGKDNRITEVEWTVYSNDTLYNTYDTHNLNLSFSTEGIYRISLRVMDKYGNWSDPYTEEIYYTLIDLGPIPEDSEGATDTNEKLNSYSLSFEGTPVFDDTYVHSGTKSIRMDFDGDQTHGIVLEDVYMDNNTKISFWLRATDDPTLTITTVGLNRGDSVFNHSKVIHPKVDQWQKVEFSIDTSLADTLKIYVNASDVIIWIDDIEVNSYK